MTLMTILRILVTQEIFIKVNKENLIKEETEDLRNKIVAEEEEEMTIPILCIWET